MARVSVLGDQTVRERRLLIGAGAVGNGVQCGVDVGTFVAFKHQLFLLFGS